MDINAIMSSQLTELQQTLQLSLLDKSLNLGAAGVIGMLEQTNHTQPQASHPYKGNIIDVSI